MRIHLTLISFFILNISLAQHVFRVLVKDADTKEGMPGVSVVHSLAKTGSTDTKGKAEISGIPGGNQKFYFSFVGYSSDSLTVFFPLANPDSVITFFLKEKAEELEEVTITSTRTGNRIEETPIKVEVLGSDEVNEKAAMQPGNISMMLTEYTGILAQQTSQSTGNINIKIQGLDGRYTQFLKDGFPLYGGFSGGLSLMQIPPLDMRQAEIIKGSASILYGADAISGVINIISKEPQKKEEWSVIMNQTSLLGTDAGTYYSKRSEKIGITCLASTSRQLPADVNNDFFTELPELTQVTFNPKLFYYFNDSTKLTVGANTSYEDRLGGDVSVIEDGVSALHTYYERSTSYRDYSTVKFERKGKKGSMLTVKNSVNYFDRRIRIRNNAFRGKQLSSYSEVSYLKKTARHTIVTGGNFVTDDFSEDEDLSGLSRGYSYYTGGVFLQDDWKLHKKVILQPGLRYDYHSRYGLYYLPHLSFLFRITDKFSSRIGGGRGYKIPSIFSSETEENAFVNVKPLADNVTPETSSGANIDFNYKTGIGSGISIAINQSFFYTVIEHALIPNGDSLLAGIVFYENAGKTIETRGAETTVNTYIGELNIIASYTYTDAKRLFDTVNKIMPLVPIHTGMLDFLYELEEQKFIIGVEGFYKSSQFTSDYEKKPDYWELGVLFQKRYRNFTFTLNFENILDERQSKHEEMYTGIVNNPQFKEVWAPTEGFIANFAVKISM